ncbi:VOC family protein [Pseudaeromonas paramecii]|uniref:VOC domain-containing protein n=1 Tax=Pseudaeromonas paramecii TaxID=2138166 RepID=A0ABP8Q7D8_9GAMM
MQQRLGLRNVEVIALAVTDLARAQQFYGEVLGLPVAEEAGLVLGYRLGGSILMLKDDGERAPTEQPNPRVTLAVDAALETQAALQALGVRVADPVALYDEAFLVGSFLDSEGNKLWFCSPKGG